MNRDIFDQQITRLRSRWKNAFDFEFVSLLANRMSGVSNEAFVETVNDFIGNRPVSKPPLIQDFLDATRGERKHRQYSLGEPQPKEIAKCHDCGDSGFIRLSRKATFEPWAKYATGSAPCHCYRGRQLIEAAARKPKSPTDLGPQFSDSWLNSYDIVEPYR